MGRGAKLINTLAMIVAPFPLLIFSVYMLVVFCEKYWFQVCGSSGIILSIIMIIITMITVLIAVIECINLKKDNEKSLVHYYMITIFITGFLVMVSLFYTSYQKELEYGLYMNTYIQSFENSSLITSFNSKYKTSAEIHSFYHKHTLFVHDIVVLLYYLEILINFIGRKFSKSFTNVISITGFDSNDIESISDAESPEAKQNPLEVPESSHSEIKPFETKVEPQIVADHNKQENSKIDSNSDSLVAASKASDNKDDNINNTNMTKNPSEKSDHNDNINNGQLKSQGKPNEKLQADQNIGVSKDDKQMKQDKKATTTGTDGITDRKEKSTAKEQLSKTAPTAPKPKTTFEFGSSTESDDDFLFNNASIKQQPKKQKNQKVNNSNVRNRRTPSLAPKQHDSIDDLLDDGFLNSESESSPKKIITQPISSRRNKPSDESNIDKDIDDLLNDSIDLNAPRPMTSRRTRAKSPFGFDNSSIEKTSTDDLFGSSFDIGHPTNKTSPIKTQRDSRPAGRSRTTNLNKRNRTKSPFGFDVSSQSDNIDEDELYNAIMNS